ncbi:MAG: amidohydrolase family protein [Myxococcota bacterium]
MSVDLSALPVIDVDSHWTEPPDLWTSRAPASLKDRALRVRRSDQGVEQWVMEDGQVMGQVGYCSIRPDGSKSQASIAFDSFDEVHPGAIEVAPRLEYMDEHGLHAQIVYPNILGFAGNLIMRVEDEAHRIFCVTAYNDASAEMQAESGGRLFPQAMLPFWDVPQAVRELERCHEELGLTGFVITDDTEAWGLPSLADTHWDPLWACAQERALPVNFHIGGGAILARTWGPYPPARMFASLSTMTQMGNMVCLANLISCGLLDRFPSLKFVSVESGVGWLPFLVESLDYQFVENGVTDLELRPSEYFRRQIYGSYWFENDPSDAIKKLGADNLMFETDFPHATCLYPGVQEQMHASIEGLEPAVQRKLLYENAARVYQLPLPDRADTSA